MFIFKALNNIYGLLGTYTYLPFWFLTPIRIVVRSLANWYYPRYLKRPVNNYGNRERNLIVSFTSFPERINDVWMVVECLKRQTLLPEKIILWLSKEQFHTTNDIPNNLKQCEDSLFEIRMVDEDIRSHKKYYYVMSEYPNKSFITCDDDVFYHPDMIKDLVEASHKYPNCIIANVSSEMSFGNDGTLLPYVQWKGNFKPYASNNRVQIGIGGVLYPPYCLNEHVLEKQLFLRLAPLADDLWLSMMARLNKTPVVQSKRSRLTLPIENGSPTLSSINNGEKNMNDVQIERMREWLRNEGLPDIYNRNWNVGF